MREATKLVRSLLRGPLLRKWVDWKTQRLSKAIGKLMLSPGLTTPNVPRMARERTALRRLLFIYDNMWEERELIPELNRLCGVTSVNVGGSKVRANAPADESLPISAFELLISALKGESFDAILVYLNSALLSQELVCLLRRNWSCPILGLNLDDKTTFGDFQIFRSHATNYRECAQWFDANLTNSRAMVDIYHASGRPCLYLPTGFHYEPENMAVRPKPSWQRQFSFVGSQKPERLAIIDQLHSVGINIDLFGQGWPGEQFVNDAWRIYQGSQLNLGIGYNVNGSQITNLKNRDFECPGAGGCYLTTYDWELADLFVVGSEILCYRNTEELIEVYSYYIRRPERCVEIARAGQARAIREHTWAHRFETVFRELGLACKLSSPT